MVSELEIREKVTEYLVSLGWSRKSIAVDYRINAQLRLDVVVRESEESNPQIIVELKSRLNVDELQDSTKLRFNPLVRQLQKYATMVKADYYLLSNGDIFIWFETDNTGRPRRLANPILPYIGSRKPSQQVAHRDEIIMVFRQLLDYLRDQSDWIIQDSQIAIILLAFFADVFGRDDSLRKALEELSENDISRLNYIEQFGLPPNELIRSRDTSRAFEILNQVSFRHVNPSDILLAIDDVFFQRIQSLFSVPRWLADALVVFAELQAESRLLDIAANVGNILAAAYMSESDLTVTGMSRNPRDSVWAKVQQIIVGNFAGQIEANDILVRSSRKLQSGDAPTHIITAPVMGEKVQVSVPGSVLYYYGIRQVEDLLLEAAIHTVADNGCVVFLVPEGLLFGGGNRSRVRNLILEKSLIRAIIALDNGALKPYSGIKTSIIILERRRPGQNDMVFMSTVADINEIPYPNTILSCSEIPDLARVLREYSHWRSEGNLLPDAISWLVPISKIEPDNMSAAYYQPDSVVDFIRESAYPVRPISEVCSLIQRGRRIKLVEGPLEVIGPATIRPMRMDLNNVGYTSTNEIPSAAIRAEHEDVVVNNIGTHLGAAAVVSHSFVGSYISQHVMLLRPRRELIDPVFLAAAINSGPVQAQIEKLATGSVMPSVTIKRLTSLNIPVPDLETQRRIAQSIHEAYDRVISAEEALQNARTVFDKLLLSLGTGEA